MFGQAPPPPPPNQGLPESSLRCRNNCQRPHRVSDSSGLRGVQPTKTKGRGINKGGPLVANNAVKIEIDVDIKNGCFEDNDRIMRTIGVHVKLELEGPCANWTMAPESQKQRYWKAFMHGEDHSTWPSFDPQGWLKATGPPKKGRVRGLPSLADPEVYDIPVPRRSTYFRGESSHNAGMRATYEAREREHTEERKMMEDKIKKLEEQVNPQYMRMFAEKVD